MKPKFGEKPSFFIKSEWLLEYLFIRVVILFIKPFPFSIKMNIGRKIGLIVYFLDKKHREIAKKNISESFEGIDDSKVKEIAKKCFEHLGRLFVEVIFLKSLYKKIFTNSKIVNWNFLQDVALKEKGYILVSGHFGNWEFVAYMQSVLGYNLNMITRPLDNPHLENFFRKIRESYGNRVIYKRNAVREMVKTLKKGEGVAFVFDQNFGEDGAIFVPFFGRLAATTPALGKVASRLNVPILPVFSFEDGYGYKVIYNEPIYPDPSLNYDENAIKLTEKVTRLLENAIKEQPSSWFFMHNRWRTRPEDIRK